MDWFKTSDPNLVQDASGQTVPVTAIDPMLDRVLPAPASAAPVPAPVAPAPSAAPPSPAAPAAPITATSVLAKLDAVTGSLNQRQPQLPIAQTSTTTTSAIPSSTLEPILTRGTDRAEKEAGAAQALGDEKARIGEQQAMTTATAAYGQQQTSEQEARDHAQRAEIARQNQLAFAAQEDPQIDPDRFIRNMSTGTSIATILLGALEGAFRGMSGQPGKSGVLDILERRVDQDIMAQKEQIASGRIRRGNMIAYFQQQGLTEETAERAAKAMAYAQLEKLTQAEIARQGAGYARAEGDALAEAIRARREQANDELRLANVPRSQTTVVRQAPGGGDSGDGFAKLLAARKAYEESGATPEQLAVFDKANGMGGMAPAGESAMARKNRLEEEKAAEPTADQAKAAVALDTVRAFGDTVGLTRDPRTGKLQVPADAPAVGWKLGKMTELRAAKNAAIEGLGRLQSGGVISPDEAKRFEVMFGDETASQQEIATNLNALETLVTGRLQPRAATRAAAAVSPESQGFRKVAP